MAIEYNTLVMQWMGCLLLSATLIIAIHLGSIVIVLGCVFLLVQLWMNYAVTDTTADFVKANCISLGIPVLIVWYVIYFDQFKSILHFLLVGY